MNYIVLDLEWNQPQNAKCMVRYPFPLYGEIIQIGAVKLDENYHIQDTFKIMVRPIHYRAMNKKVAKLTKITDEDLQSGFPFQLAMKYFRKWCGKEFVFFTWGPDDIGILRDNLDMYAMNTAWLPSTYNLQVIFDGQITKENRQVSLSYAMEKIGEPAREAHDALHDAQNTVCVCLHLDMVKGLEEYAELQKQMALHPTIRAERSESTKVYKTKEEALNDPEVITFYCPRCSAMVNCVGIVKQNSNKYVAIGQCENGDELFVRFKFTKWNEGRFTVSRILYDMDEENRSYYTLKKQQAEEVAEAAALYMKNYAIGG